jgi:hypothetical protein
VCCKDKIIKATKVVALWLKKKGTWGFDYKNGRRRDHFIKSTNYNLKYFWVSSALIYGAGRGFADKEYR